MKTPMMSSAARAWPTPWALMPADRAISTCAGSGYDADSAVAPPPAVTPDDIQILAGGGPGTRPADCQAKPSSRT
jgi:hypothetical protein